MEKGFFTKDEAGYLELLLEDKGKRIVLYHSDPDGVCSAAMIAKEFPGIEFIPRKGPTLAKDFADIIIRKKPDVLIAIDLPIDQEIETLKRMRKEVPGLRVSIIDHHIYERNMNPDVLHINPRFHKKDIYMPAACMIYRLMESMGFDMKPMLWIAAVGVIGDMGMPDCRKLLSEAKNEFPYLLKKGPRDSKIMDAVETISAVITMTGLKGAANCLSALKKSDGFEDFVKNEKLSGLRSDFREEFEYVTGGFGKEKTEHTKKIWSYQINSAYSITSQVANHFGIEFPDNIIIIRKAHQQGWKFSVRGHRTKLNLGNIVKRSVEGIGSGGGHEKAAAGLVSDWDRFIERFVKNAK